jgi:site-specific DNA-methyltransferase (adenine-specific)
MVSSKITLYHGDCLEFMKTLDDKSIDAVVTDPPYGYLKHKLDRLFDEQAFFGECKRIIKKDGFYVGFGRGEKE